MLVQTLDDFLIERRKFAEFVLEHVFDIFLSELAEIIQTDKTFSVPIGHALLDEIEKRWPDQFCDHSAVWRLRFSADLTDQRRGCSLAHRDFAAELSCCPATCRCPLESMIRSPKVSHGT